MHWKQNDFSLMNEISPDSSGIHTYPTILTVDTIDLRPILLILNAKSMNEITS